jgi:hypothetical protein
MAQVELTDDALIVHVRGLDRLFALRNRVEVPLSHVVGAEADPEEARKLWHGVRAGGTWVPGFVTAGTFYQSGERVFWDVHKPENTIVIRLKEEQFGRLVIEVEDPETTVARVNEAAKASGRT